MISYVQSFHLNNRVDALEYIGEHKHYKFYEMIPIELLIMSFGGNRVSLYQDANRNSKLSILLSNNKIFLQDRLTMVEIPCSLIDSLYMTLPR